MIAYIIYHTTSSMSIFFHKAFEIILPCLLGRAFILCSYIIIYQ
nr:MAG TPA: hypothetical protein [Caudoviricetes sp.]